MAVPEQARTKAAAAAASRVGARAQTFKKNHDDDDGVCEITRGASPFRAGRRLEQPARRPHPMTTTLNKDLRAGSDALALLEDARFIALIGAQQGLGLFAFA